MQKTEDAIRWKGRAISRELLEQYVHSTSRHLKEFGLKPGSQVVIRAALSPSYLIVLLSLWHMGIAPYLLKGPLENFVPLFKEKTAGAPLVFLDDPKGLFRREMLLADMVTLEIVEGFLSAASMDDLSWGPASRAAVLVASNGQEDPVTFGELSDLLEEDEPGGKMTFPAPLEERRGLSFFYRSIITGKTLYI